MAVHENESPSLGVVQADDSLIGCVIAGKFSLRECIGVGASGTVYKADQTSLGRTVAVKVLRPELAGDPRFVKRFHAEARAASRLNHPNVVSVIDFGQADNGLLYLVMEFLRGSTLTEVLRTESLHPDRITEIIGQILSALEDAHAGGIVHADLKADNIMVEHRRGGWDLIKVVDFGIARLTGSREDESESQDDTICGTPEYMAPEVIRGREPTPASDLYAVGIVLYELLVGLTPFAGVPTMEVLKRHINEEPIPPSLRDGAAKVPATLEKVAMRALRKEPSERFENAAEFARALKAWPQEDAPAPSEVECEDCGTTSSNSFKFCPECGSAMPVREEFELALDDTGHDEIWADDAPTADIDKSDLQAIFKPTRSPTKQPTDEAPIPASSLFPIPLIGHERESAELMEFLCGDVPGLLHLQGSAGAGCTRLLRQACEKAAEAERVIFLAGPDPAGLASPFYPIRAAIAAILQLPHVCSYEDIGRALEDLGLSKRDLPGIGELFQHEGGGLHRLEGPVRRRELFAATIRVLRAAGQRYGAVLAFEDYASFDEPSQQLLHKLIESNHRSPVVCIVITSDDTCPPWEGERRVDVLPLRDEDLRALVTYCATRGQPDLITVEELRTFTRGEPGHIHQLLRYVIEGGDLESPPESLADLIAARCDFLPSVAKRVLQAAAVFGVSLRSEDLRDTLASSIGRVEMEAAVTLLCSRDMLCLEGEMLHFAHKMLRDVIYESTPADVRRGLHQDAGDVLIASVNDPLVLGMHAERCGATDRAAELLTRAGDNAVTQLDDQGAVAIFNRALKATRKTLLTDADPRAKRQLVAVSIKLADALRVCGEIGLAKGILAEVGDMYNDAPALQTQLLRASAKLLAATGDTAAAIELYREAIALAIPLLAVDILADAYLDLATMLLRQGDNDSAIAELEEGIDLITMGEGPSVKQAPKPFWRLLLRLGQLYKVKNNFDKALQLCQHAARLCRIQYAPVGAARAYATMAGVLESKGDNAKAQAYRQRAIEEMRELGDRRGTAELLLAGSKMSQAVRRIAPASAREARLLAEEIGWSEGAKQARGKSE